MFISTTSIVLFCIALFLLDVRSQENERIAKEHREARAAKDD